jgi:hypothetical protein
MESPAEIGPQKKLQSEVVSKKLSSFKDKFSPGVIEAVTADKTSKKDYKIEVAEIQPDSIITRTTETWDGGSRQTIEYGNNYQASSEWGNQPGDFSVITTLGQGYNETSININIKAKGSLTQKIKCSTEDAQNTAYGTQPLLRGEFFKYAGQGGMTEDKSITFEGKVSTRRFWSEDKWLGHGDRYRMHVVTEEDGVVKSGTMDHGISLGIPELKIVHPSTQQ